MALKFKSVFALLHMKIISGQWPEGYKIPTEMELCEHFEVSRVLAFTLNEHLLSR